MSLPQIVPFGNTSKNVAISLFTVSGSLSYSGTHCVTTPPGFRCCFTSSKYSFEYSVALPFTHGWIGSDVMMSNFSVRGQHEVARVVVDDLGARIVHHVVVLRAEILGGGGRNQRLHFADHDALHLRMHHERPRRHARAEAHDQHRFRIRVHQRRQVPQHALQPHVVGFGGGFHLAADVELDRAIVPLRDRDRGVDALARVQHFGPAHRRHHAPPVGDQHARHRRDALRQQHDDRPPPRPPGQPRPANGTGRNSGTSISSPLTAERARSAPPGSARVPIHGTSIRLNASAPTIAPTVLAA